MLTRLRACDPGSWGWQSGTISTPGDGREIAIETSAEGAVTLNRATAPGIGLWLPPFTLRLARLHAALEVMGFNHPAAVVEITPPERKPASTDSYAEIRSTGPNGPAAAVTARRL